MVRKIKKQPKSVDMILEIGVLYVIQNGKRVLVRPQIPRHRPYRDAYRKLFGKLGHFPEDGNYRFTGKKMRRIK